MPLCQLRRCAARRPGRQFLPAASGRPPRVRRASSLRPGHSNTRRRTISAVSVSAAIITGLPTWSGFFLNHCPPASSPEPCAGSEAGMGTGGMAWPEPRACSEIMLDEVINSAAIAAPAISERGVDDFSRQGTGGLVLGPERPNDIAPGLEKLAVTLGHHREPRFAAQLPG